MGNSASSGRGHHDGTVDFGYLSPQGIYTGPRDWNQAVVTQLIVERKLAPFYRPLEDYEEDWDDEQILAARKEPPEAEGGESSRAESVSSASTKGHAKRPSAVKEPARHPEAAIYRGAVECPICFLYYPSNINRSRCCDQAICTECFVQIKRVEPTTTHLVSEPAACPYCVQENFGIVYTPPPWRTGINSEGATPPSWPDSPKATSDAAANSSMKRRRKSFGHNDPEVVTVDQIHPDWEAKLAAVRAAVARRANRRIIMRQVGDRLIPVGVTSGRVHAISTEEGGVDNAEGGSDRRRRRRQQNQDLNQFLGSMGLGGQDLEELMVMEAMRLSLLEHEAQQKRQKEEEEKRQREEAAAAASSAAETRSASSAEVERSPESTVFAPAEAVPSSEPNPSSESTLAASQPTPDTTPIPRSRISTSSQARASSPNLEVLSPPSGHAMSSQEGRRSGRSTPNSQYGVISAAILGAVSTASAVASPSPSPKQEQSNPVAETEAFTETTEAGPVSTSTADGEAGPLVPPAVVADGEPTVTPSSDHPTERPAMEHPSSLASSIAPYDILPSSPESTVSKPLLDSAAPATPAVEAEPSAATVN